MFSNFCGKFAASYYWAEKYRTGRAWHDDVGFGWINRIALVLQSKIPIAKQLCKNGGYLNE